MAEQKLKGTEAEEQRLAKCESITSVHLDLLLECGDAGGRGSVLWSVLRWCRSQARAD